MGESPCNAKSFGTEHFKQIDAEPKDMEGQGKDPLTKKGPHYGKFNPKNEILDVLLSEIYYFLENILLKVAK